MVWQTILNLLANPAVDVGIHIMIVIIFLMEVWQHYSHHRKQKRKRSEPTYTLDEARLLLFDEAVERITSSYDPRIPHEIVKGY